MDMDASRNGALLFELTVAGPSGDGASTSDASAPRTHAGVLEFRCVRGSTPIELYCILC